MNRLRRATAGLALAGLLSMYGCAKDGHPAVPFPGLIASISLPANPVSSSNLKPILETCSFSQFGKYNIDHEATTYTSVTIALGDMDGDGDADAMMAFTRSNNSAGIYFCENKIKK